MKALVVSLLIIIQALAVNGQSYSDHISVNFFLLDECRISQNISGEINSVKEAFDQAPFSYACYFSNRSSTMENIEAFVTTYNIDIQYFTDYNKERMHHLGATIAPQVVVYDEVHHTILYRGRIDNSYASIGNRRRVTTSRDLRDALMAILNKEKIKQRETEAIGCFLN